jgi:biopolymer transport protein ExbD
MRARPERTIPEAGFDLTSMIDVVLLLIIFFMASAQFARTMRAEVALPEEAGEATARPAERSLYIDVRADGVYLLAGEEVALDRLVQLVVADLKRRGEVDADDASTPVAGPSVTGSRGATGERVEVVVRADRAALGRHLNALAAALTGAGIRDWKLAVAGRSASRAGKDGAAL